MSQQTKYLCDVCGKELNSQFLDNFVVLYYQGTPSVSDISFSRFSESFPEKFWKHKEVYKQMVCKDCSDVEVDHNYGDNNSGPSFNCISFLKKIRLIK